jgi:hypothetical protein
MTVRRAEQTIQRTLCEHLRLRAVPNLYWFHVGNGGLRSKTEAAIFSGLGLRRGCPDLFFVHRGEVFAIELKSESGRATAAQLQAIADIRRAGGSAEICRGLDAALGVLEQWGLLRGQASITNTARGGIRASRGERPMRKINIELTHHELWGNSCTLCGNRIERQVVCDDVLAQGYDSEREGHEVTVCASCLASEDVGARIEQHAAAIEQRAADMLKRAAWVRSLTGRLNLPAYADYRAALDEIGADLQRAVDECRAELPS